jgi:hypothetical protein
MMTRSAAARERRLPVTRDIHVKDYNGGESYLEKPVASSAQHEPDFVSPSPLRFAERTR